MTTREEYSYAEIMLITDRQDNFYVNPDLKSEMQSHSTRYSSRESRVRKYLSSREKIEVKPCIKSLVSWLEACLQDLNPFMVELQVHFHVAISI